MDEDRVFSVKEGGTYILVPAHHDEVPDLVITDAGPYMIFKHPQEVRDDGDLMEV